MSESKGSFWTTPNGLAAIVLIGIVVYYLLAEHRAHFFGALPFLILLLCPLMHVFMHGGHRHGGHGHGEEGRHDRDESGGRD
jgi:hypothetical protein